MKDRLYDCFFCGMPRVKRYPCVYCAIFTKYRNPSLHRVAITPREER